MCSCAHDFPLMSRPIARGLEAMTNSSFITKLYETFNGTQTLLGESVMQRAEHGSKAERGGARRRRAVHPRLYFLLEPCLGGELYATYIRHLEAQV